MTSEQLKALAYDRVRELMALYSYTDNRLLLRPVTQTELRAELDEKLAAFIGCVVQDLSAIVESP
jgi:hypothetical protein